MIRLLIAAMILLVGISESHAQAVGGNTTAPATNFHIDRPLTLNGATIIAPKAGRLMAFNIGTGVVPSDGSVTPDGCWKVAAPNSGDSSTMTAMGNVAGPVYFNSGLMLVFSDYIDASNPSVGSCYTLHKANAEWISVTYN